jgi:hypothetical protein
MPRQVSADERARRLGDVAAILIDLARRQAAQVAAAEEGKQVSRPADDDAGKGSNGA